ncbi:nitroreductase family protein [Hoyosella sp. G463]|uniref:Putative NAD(P)H nitroreductase n=1 Tax=Lolliginicoccus lacisalsi TaxID=2742202 RepID=A0A927JEE2_9ACTN|nr:nitroreductase family protein [Lolliginicoccus lacisalsi]
MADLLSARRSFLTLTDEAPSDADITRLVQACTSVADHKALRPWRVITLRGAARERMGEAIAGHMHGDVPGLTDPEQIEDARKLAAKPLRAPLLIALVHRAVRPPSVPEWEQIATAAGVGHYLSLLLHDEGWGVVWRTGPFVDMPAVATMHGLAAHERLLGWLYVGGIEPGDDKPRNRKIDAEHLITRLA